jgi:hypothetical protein
MRISILEKCEEFLEKYEFQSLKNANFNFSKMRISILEKCEEFF